MSLVFTGEGFLIVAEMVIQAHIPVMIIEGIFTRFVFVYILRVRPEMVGILYARGIICY